MSKSIHEDFSLMRGGPTWRALQPLTWLFPRAQPALLVTGLLLLLTVVPAGLLAWRAGTALPGNVTVPFLLDWFVLSRFLLALPLLVLVARFSDRMVGQAVRHFSTCGVVSDDIRSRFEGVLAAALRARNAWWPELLCLALAVSPAFLTALEGAATQLGPAQDSYWRFGAEGHVTAAGAWMETVAAPLFRFVILLWLWRFLLWTWMLWRFSRLPLALRATHPDNACGLAFLGLAQSRFAVLSAAGALVLCGNGLNQMVYAGQSLDSFKYMIAAYIIAATVVLLIPLLLLSTSLARTRRRDLARYDAVAQRLVQAFDVQWNDELRSQPDSALLDCPSPQTMADFSAVHGNIRAANILPINRWDLARMVAAAALPFAPLLFIAMSVDELMRRMLSVLV